MVVVTSPLQLNEIEQKKRKQTLERAKANHLSKQLQMRLQYAKLKVEHGWQRQNLNEVENLYFHHSHLRNMRFDATPRPHHATISHPRVPSSLLVSAEPLVLAEGSAVPGQIAGPTPVANDSSSDYVSPSYQSMSELADGWPSSQIHPYPTLQPIVVPSSTSALDLSDPTILARLAQLQVHVQIPLQLQSQLQSQSSPHQPSTTTAPPITTSTSQSVQPPQNHPQPGFATSTPASTLHHPSTPSQPPIPATSSTSAAPTPPVPITSIPTSTPIAPAALTYDSFWSTHASSTGPTRALYRTHTGFTASATPAGNVAMLTPGGHAAIMTAEGVYVGGGGSRSG